MMSKKRSVIKRYRSYIFFSLKIIASHINLLGGKSISFFLKKKAPVGKFINLTLFSSQVEKDWISSLRLALTKFAW